MKFLFVIPVIIILILLIKIHLLQKSADEIAEAFADRLSTDTNTLISLSSRDGHMRRLAVVINDQLRILRQQRHRYLTGDRELKEAVTGISHDLRTPLTAICGYLDLLEREKMPDTAARYLALIGNRTEAMKNLTEELFRYSVVLSAQSLTLEPVCVNDVLEESIAGLYGALTERGITPELDIPAEKLIRTLDRAALGRIFGNILSNALKYSDGDLKITLSREGTICFSNRASCLDGVQVGRLFDRFYTVETARNSTGLGLAIAKTLAEQMQGSIGAAYEDGSLRISLAFPYN